MYDFFKRLVELSLVILLLPLFIVVAFTTALIILVQGEKLFFVQERAGMNGKIFQLYKFRTLDSNEQPIRMGKVIRQLGCDELPQLINLLKGDMRLIGPRPLLPEYTSRYSVFQSQRLLVKPGLTGLAQIKGFNNLSWTHKFRYDVFYVNNEGFLLDMYVMLKTVVIFVNFTRLRSEVNHAAIPFGKEI